MKIDLCIRQPPARKARNFHHNRLAFVCLHPIGSLSPCLALCSIIVMLTHTRTHSKRKQTTHMAPRQPCAHRKTRHVMGMWEWTSETDWNNGKAYASQRPFAVTEWRKVSLYANEQVWPLIIKKTLVQGEPLSKKAMLCPIRRLSASCHAVKTKFTITGESELFYPQSKHKCHKCLGHLIQSQHELLSRS